MIELFLAQPWYIMLPIVVGFYAAFCVALYYYTYLLYVLLIGYKDVAKSWPWYKKYPYGLLFFSGYVTDLLYNLLGASWIHLYYAFADNRCSPFYYMFFQYRNWHGWKRLYYYTYTERIQSIIDDRNLNRWSSTYSWAYQTAIKLNKHDNGHITYRRDTNG